MLGLEIGLLGRPHVRYAGEPWPLHVSNASWSILALLAASEHGVSRELLAATLWPDDERVAGLANVRRHLHAIARALPPRDEPWIFANNKTIALDRAAASVDVVEFERLLAKGCDAQAVEVYGGDLLPLVTEDGIVANRERLRLAYLDALERLTSQALAARAYRKALDYAERLLATDEWREEAVRAWMTAQYESGDAPAALSMYERLAERLRDEFNAEPMPQTVALRDFISAGLPLPALAEAAIERYAGQPAQQGWKQPFVGRSEPLERLTALWSRTVRGRGGVAFITGESGIGKSRLASEFATFVRARGGRTLAGTTANPESAPYEAIAMALRAALDAGVASIGDMWLAVLARIVPEIHSLRPGLDPTEEISLERSRERLFEAIVRLLEHLARRQPLCLIFEDLHWAGPGTIELVEALARRVGTLPIAVVATYRSGEASADVARGLRSRLVRERRAIACTLDRLSAGDVATIVGAGVENADGALCERIAASSEGNPLFVAQLVANYRETGAEPDEGLTTSGLADAIAARFRLLVPTVRAIAEMAAALGTSFRADVLAAAGDWKESDVLDALGSLMDRAIVRESDGDLDYAFGHAHFAATLYAQSTDEERTARHRRIAGVLERELSEDAPSAALVARHWKLAGEGGRAAELYLEAARAALRLSARGDAVAFAREVLALAREAGLRFDAYVLLSQTLRGFGDAAVWKRDLDALCELAADMSAERRFAALEQRETYFHQIGDRTNQRAAVDAMLQLTSAEGTPMQRVATLRAVGRLSIAQSQLAQALESLQEALRIALDSGFSEEAFITRELIAHARARLHGYAAASAEIAAMRDSIRLEPSRQREMRVLRLELLAASTRAPSESHRIAERLASIAREVGDLESEVTARIELAWAAQFESDVPVARTYYDEALALARRLGYKKTIGGLLMDRGSFEHRIGNTRDAVAFYDAALATAEEIGSPTFTSTCLSNRAMMMALDGDPAEACASALRAVEIAAPFGDRRCSAGARSALGIATIAAGDLDEGLAMLSESIATRREIGDLLGLAEDLSASAGALVERQRESEATSLLRELRDLYEADPQQCEYPTRVCFLLGLDAERRAAPEEARSYFVRGIDHRKSELARAPDDEARSTLERRWFNRALSERAPR